MSSFFHAFLQEPFKPGPEQGSQEKFLGLVVALRGQGGEKVEFQTEVIGRFGLAGQIIAVLAIEIPGALGGPTKEGPVAIQVDRGVRGDRLAGHGIDEQASVLGAQVITMVDGLLLPGAEEPLIVKEV